MRLKSSVTNEGFKSISFSITRNAKRIHDDTSDDNNDIDICGARARFCSDIISIVMD